MKFIALLYAIGVGFGIVWISKYNGGNPAIAFLITISIAFLIYLFTKENLLSDILGFDFKLLIRLFSIGLIGLIIYFIYQNFFSDEPKLTWHAHDSEITAIVYSPDGKTITTGSTDQTIKFWNSKTGTLTRVIKNKQEAQSNYSEPVNYIAYSRNNSALVVSGIYSGFNYYSTTGTQKSKVLGKENLSMVQKLIFDQQYHNYIYTVSDGILKRISSLNGKIVPVSDSSGFVGESNFALSKELVTYLLYDTLIIEPNNSNRQAYRIPLPIDNYESLFCDECLNIEISDDSRFLTVQCTEFVGLFDIRQRQFMHWIEIHNISDVKFVPNSKTIAICSFEGEIQFYNIYTGEYENNIRTNESILKIAISPDGKNIATALGYPSDVMVWDIPKIVE